jgi:hypothetical protein
MSFCRSEANYLPLRLPRKRLSSTDFIGHKKKRKGGDQADLAGEAVLNFGADALLQP